MTRDSASGEPFEYIGNELELFQLAENWKRYVAGRVEPYMNGQVLEVGAGLGANVPYLHRDNLDRFVSLEPDAGLCDQYRQRQKSGLIPDRCELIEGTLQELPTDDLFDALIYLDVIEHIEDDRAEVARALERLRPGGHLIVLCPAHNWLYSPFDKAIGHFRRYNKKMYRALTDQPLVRMEYLDSVGLFASMANRLLLRQSSPTEKQIRTWDRLFVTASKFVDPLTCHLIGKSLLGVWQK